MVKNAKSRLFCKEDFMSARDLIPTAIYFVLMVVVMLIFQMIAAFSPWFYLFAPVAQGIVALPVFMLWMLKVKKIGTCTIHSVLMGLIYFIAGGSWVCPVIWIPMGIIMDLVRYALMKKPQIANSIVYALYVLAGAMSTFLPLFILGDSLFNTFIEMGMSIDYVNVLKGVMSVQMLVLITSVSLASGFIYGIIGYAMFKKKFIAAGFVAED
ncbi:MAG: MptD family putative ECF transporter S component [Spirochaetales bacterium]